MAMAWISVGYGSDIEGVGDSLLLSAEQTLRINFIQFLNETVGLHCSVPCPKVVSK